MQITQVDEPDVDTAREDSEDDDMADKQDFMIGTLVEGALDATKPEKPNGTIHTESLPAQFRACYDKYETEMN